MFSLGLQKVFYIYWEFDQLYLGRGWVQFSRSYAEVLPELLSVIKMANFVLNRNQNLFWGLLRARYLNKALQMFPFVFLDSPRALQLCSKSSRKTSQGEAYSGENLERSLRVWFFSVEFPGKLL